MFCLALVLLRLSLIIPSRPSLNRVIQKESSNSSTATEDFGSGDKEEEEDAMVTQEDHDGHKFEVFQTIFTTIQCMGSSVELRSALKEYGDTYILVRRISSGTNSGFTHRQMNVAKDCLVQFVRDTDDEKSLGRDLGPQNSNEAMVKYWKGHIHQLCCTEFLKSQGDRATTGRSRARHGRQQFKQGFADQVDLDAINRAVLRKGKRK